MYDLTNDEVLYKLNKKLNNAYYEMLVLQEQCANLPNINYETQTIKQIDNICDVSFAEVPYAIEMEPHLITEFYSR